MKKEDNIHKITNVDGVVNFAKCSNACRTEEHAHDHIHFSYGKCHNEICIKNAVPEIRLPENFSISSYNLVISGICPKCR